MSEGDPTSVHGVIKSLAGLDTDQQPAAFARGIKSVSSSNILTAMRSLRRLNLLLPGSGIGRRSADNLMNSIMQEELDSRDNG